MARVGYARVSSVGQNLESQVKKLKEAGCDPIYEEKMSGRDDNRPQLQECLRFVRKGDTLVVTKLDRLARSILHLASIADILKKKEVDFQVLDQRIDTSTPGGRAMFGMLGVFAEFENDLRRERQMDGLAHAKAQGKHLGRKFKLSTNQIEALKADRAAGMPISALMHAYGLSQASVYRYLGESHPVVSEREAEAS